MTLRAPGLHAPGLHAQGFRALGFRALGFRGLGFRTLGLGSAAAALVLSGCTPAPTPHPHYVLGPAYQAGGVWHYPRDVDTLDETGIAAIARKPPSGLTSDGEVFDQGALAAGHPTIQLPAIARVTNLENGRQVVVRINDRGSGDPHRLIEVTRRAATLLDFPPDGLARVRVELLPRETEAAVDSVPGAPKLAVAAAPRSAIETTDLPAPGTPAAIAAPSASTPVPLPGPDDTAKPAAEPLRLPERLTQVTPNPGRLVVRLDTFDEFQYAAAQQAKMAAAGAHIVYLTSGRGQQFRVDVGPLPSIARADAVLDQALALGIPDARIVVE
ncbi:MAG TPA: RlpA-like double-psi beta-barrel domain-containing protein [Rhodopila sp.]|uniref:septal ring lytic transglycosylase RlpA family protein n=1 Tax=Rhodopila sp. TaxID=2480087 RepID=UPI002C78D1AC|nr:RlpA-like double-psi beta-barrel domain-containing protein [Rhodopila sp.]HVY18247.1 RlpA-like double-psi beta-barrel domain-containing protein [Rhodopila sp.]